MRTSDCIPRSCPSLAGSWLPDMDLNHDKQIQSLLCYRYTIGQTSDFKVEGSWLESRLVSSACNGGAHLRFLLDLLLSLTPCFSGVLRGNWATVRNRQMHV